MANGSSDYDDEFMQPVVRHASPDFSRMAVKRVFAPWHKPRKHWIRQFQWAAESGKLIDSLKLANNRALMYLTLPGPDMLDVRSLHHLCQERGAKLRFIGFITPRPEDISELELSEAEVSDLANVDESFSRVVRADFQSLADPQSIGVSAIRNEDAFDVVNVDLCGSVGEFAPLDKQRAYFDSIREIFASQVRKRRPGEPWLFFLTTRANFDKISSGSREAFFRLLLQACHESPELGGALKLCLNVSIADLQDCIAGGPGKSYVFELAFSAAVCEWVAHILINYTPQVRVSLLASSRGYGVRRPGAYDMLSLGFKCETEFAETTDSSGLSGVAPSSAEVMRKTEHPSVVEMVSALQKLVNIDIQFGDEPSYRTITERAREFMVSARFDGDAYREFCWKAPEAPSVPTERWTPSRR